MAASISRSAAFMGTVILCILQFVASLVEAATPGQPAKLVSPATRPATAPAKPVAWGPAVRWLTGEHVPNMLRSPAGWIGQHVWLVRAEPLNGTDGQAIPGLLRLVVERNYNAMPAPAAITMPANALGDEGQSYFKLLVPGERIILWHLAKANAFWTAPSGRQGLFCRIGGSATSKPDADLLNSLELIGLYRHASGDARRSADAARDILASRLGVAVSYLCQDMLDGSGPLAGQANAAVKEVWPKVSRSFQASARDGERRLVDLWSQMKPVLVDGKQQFKVYPGNDERVMRVVRKIIRGLCHHHGLLPYVTDRRVWADVQKFAIPPQFLNEMPEFERGADVFKYQCISVNEGGIHSGWLLTFYERLRFFGFITISEEGVSSLDGFEAPK